jgi:hypothetical protein
MWAIDLSTNSVMAVVNTFKSYASGVLGALEQSTRLLVPANKAS